jgi:hypothetical protein
VAANREKSLNGESSNVVAGLNKPAEPEAEKTVERPRKPEGGT